MNLFEKLPKLALQALLLGGVWEYVSFTGAVDYPSLALRLQIAFRGSQKLSDCV